MRRHGRTAIAALAAIAVLLLVAGCGQKGSLYLPAPPASAPASR